MRSLIVVPAAVLALTAGCATSTPAGDASITDRVLESTTVAPVSPAADPYTSTDRTDAILQSVAAGEGIDMPDGMASQYADIICQGLDDGLSPMALVRIAASELTQWDSGQHSFLVGASIGAKCPEFSYLVGGA